MPKIIDCTFAIIDVKRGRNALYKRMMDRATEPRIPVVIRGFITAVHSRDDGVSREFSLEVTSAEELEPDYTGPARDGIEEYKLTRERVAVLSEHCLTKDIALESEREAHYRTQAALRSKDAAMAVLFSRLRALGDDCADLIP